MKDILNLIESNPNIKIRTNKDVLRNEGYLKSLKEEKERGE